MSSSTVTTTDAVVLGGGPAGASAALTLSQAGIKTLLLERKKLPRDKVCSGMLMGNWAVSVVESVFGAIPNEVLSIPPVLTGHMFHVPGAEPVSLAMRTPIGWRKHLDGWMVRRSMTAGAAFWEGSYVESMSEDSGGYTLKVVRSKEVLTVRTRFVVGAEGAGSPTRKALFPNLEVRISKPLRNVYKGSLNLEKDYYHWFFPKGAIRPRFGVNHKDDVYMLEGRDIIELAPEIEKILKPKGHDQSAKPLIKDGCMIAILHDQLLDGSFKPGRGNCLLVGDAAGLILPVTFEGISTAVWSGKLAAEAIKAALSGGGEAFQLYDTALRPVLQMISKFKKVEKEVSGLSEKGPRALAEGLARAYRMGDE